MHSSNDEIFVAKRELVEMFGSPEGLGRRYLFGRNSDSAAISRVFTVEAFVDDFAETGTVWNGKPVIRSSDVPSYGIVVNCATCISPVSTTRRLKALNFFGLLALSDICNAYPDSVPLPNFILQTKEDLKEHSAAWRNLTDALVDSESKRTLSDLLAFRVTADCNVMEKYEIRIKDQYFEEFLELDAHEIFVDGGFDGDTTEEFCRRCGSYRKIFLFEPSTANIVKARSRLKEQHSIEFIQKGLSDSVGTLCFDDAGPAGVVSESGTTTINVTTLDEQIKEKVSFIKMDLEGWELQALVGSKRHIQEDHPKLAIAVYHHPSHFRKVFDFVTGIRTDYKVYLRHYTEGWSETVMFFVPIHGSN
jgi:FkbM family methyltransferase